MYASFLAYIPFLQIISNRKIFIYLALFLILIISSLLTCYVIFYNYKYKSENIPSKSLVKKNLIEEIKCNIVILGDNKLFFNWFSSIILFIYINTQVGFFPKFPRFI